MHANDQVRPTLAVIRVPWAAFAWLDMRLEDAVKAAMSLSIVKL